MSKKIDMPLGKRYGTLVIISDKIPNTTPLRYTVLCDCGKSFVTSGSLLRNGATVNCGCKRSERTRLSSTTHGLSYTPEYKVWRSMIVRCYYKSSNRYNLYGGRGITICQEWRHNPSSFCTWAINNGYRKGLNIDRIDTDGNYSPFNCRWVTPKVNQNNRRNNKCFIIKGVKYTVSELCENSLIKSKTIYKRLSKGMDIETALTKPVLTNRNKL